MTTQHQCYEGYELHTIPLNQTEDLFIADLDNLVTKRIALYRYLLELTKLSAQQDTKQGQDNQGYKQKIEPNHATKILQEEQKLETANDENEDVFFKINNLSFDRKDFLGIQKLNIELYKEISSLQDDLKLKFTKSSGKQCAETARNCMKDYLGIEWVKGGWTHVCSGKEEVPKRESKLKKDLPDFIEFVTNKIPENQKLIVPVSFGGSEPSDDFKSEDHHCFVLEINSKDDWKITQSYANLYYEQTSTFDPILWQKLIWTENSYLEPGTISNMKRNAEMLFGSSFVVTAGNLKEGMDLYIKTFPIPNVI